MIEKIERVFNSRLEAEKSEPWGEKINFIRRSAYRFNLTCPYNSNGVTLSTVGKSERERPGGRWLWCVVAWRMSYIDVFYSENPLHLFKTSATGLPNPAIAGSKITIYLFFFQTCIMKL